MQTARTRLSWRLAIIGIYLAVVTSQVDREHPRAWVGDIFLPPAWSASARALRQHHTISARLAAASIKGGDSWHR